YVALTAAVYAGELCDRMERLDRYSVYDLLRQYFLPDRDGDHRQHHHLFHGGLCLCTAAVYFAQSLVCDHARHDHAALSCRIDPAIYPLQRTELGQYVFAL